MGPASGLILSADSALPGPLTARFSWPGLRLSPHVNDDHKQKASAFARTPLTLAVVLNRPSLPLSTLNSTLLLALHNPYSQWCVARSRPLSSCLCMVATPRPWRAAPPIFRSFCVANQRALDRLILLPKSRSLSSRRPSLSL